MGTFWEVLKCINQSSGKDGRGRNTSLQLVFIFGKCVKAMSFQLTIAEENSFLKNIFLLTDYLLTDQSSKSYSPTKTSQFLRLLRDNLTKKIPRKRILQCCQENCRNLKNKHFLKVAQGQFQKSLLIFGTGTLLFPYNPLNSVTIYGPLYYLPHYLPFPKKGKSHNAHKQKFVLEHLFFLKKCWLQISTMFSLYENTIRDGGGTAL